MRLFYVGDTVQIKVGTFKGLEAVVYRSGTLDAVHVRVDGSAPKAYAARSLTLIKGGEVRAQVQAEAAAELARITAAIDEHNAAMRRTPEDVAAEVAANPGPIVRDPLAEHFEANPVTPGALAGTVRPVLPTADEVRNLSAAEAAALVRPAAAGRSGAARVARKFGQCRWCPVRSNYDDLAAHEAAHIGKGRKVVRQGEPDGPIGEVIEVRRGMHRVSFAGLDPLWMPASGLAPASATERPAGRVYPLGRPESGEDARFKAGLWIDVVHAIEAAGFPPLGAGDLARLQAMLFRFIYDDGE